MALDNGGRLLVDADARAARIARQDAEQSLLAVAVEEMLVDHHARQEAEPRADLRDLLAAGNHDAAHDRGPGRGTAEDAATLQQLLELLLDTGPAIGGGQARLIAATHPDAR